MTGGYVSRGTPSIDRRKERAEQLRRRRKAEILAAACRLFSIKGYHHSSVADILEAAGIARGTFYLYFTSKRAIFEELLEGMLGQIRGAVSRIQLDTPEAGSPLAPGWSGERSAVLTMASW